MNIKEYFFQFYKKISDVYTRLGGNINCEKKLVRSKPTQKN
jgi:hypothetical protein